MAKRHGRRGGDASDWRVASQCCGSKRPKNSCSACGTDNRHPRHCRGHPKWAGDRARNKARFNESRRDSSRRRMVATSTTETVPAWQKRARPCTPTSTCRGSGSSMRPMTTLQKHLRSRPLSPATDRSTCADFSKRYLNCTKQNSFPSGSCIT